MPEPTAPPHARHRRAVGGLAATVAAAACVSALSPAAAGQAPAAPQTVYNAIAAISAHDVWAVGTAFAHSQTTFAEHWDGSAWTRASTPNPRGTDTASLTAVDATGSADVWAAGFYRNPKTATVEPLALQWNGSAWKSVMPVAPANGGAFYGLSVVRPGDVWAVGQDQAGQGFAEHWDGSTWRLSPLPTPAGASGFTLTGVSGVSSSDVWAVGMSTPNGGTNQDPVAMHWDGTAWTLASPKDPSGHDLSQLTAVTAIGSRHVVAVGSGSFHGAQQPLVETWNGTAWKAKVAPSPAGATSGDFSAVSAVSASDVWAVGTYDDASFNGVGLFEHWDGNAWSVVAGPGAGGAQLMTGVSALTAGSVWAGGWQFGAAELAVTEHWNGTRWRVK